MPTEDTKFHLETFEKQIKDWQRRFTKDPNDRLFINYTFISEKIKALAKISLNPAIESFNTLREEYAEKYKHKDLKYHTEAATANCDLIKKMLKELYDMYQHQEPYERIRTRWNIHFSAIPKRLTHIRERIYIIDRILANEQTEKHL